MPKKQDLEFCQYYEFDNLPLVKSDLCKIKGFISDSSTWMQLPDSVFYKSNGTASVSNIIEHIS